MLLFLTLGLLAVSLAHLSFLKKNDLFLYLAFLVILVVMAFQDSVSVDFPSYIEDFDKIADGKMRAVLFRSQADREVAIEPGWFAVNYLVGLLIPSFHAVAFIVLGFYCFSLVKLISMVVPDTYRWLAVAYFYLNPMIFNMSGIRQTVAIGFFILAVCSLLNNDGKGIAWAAVWVLLGALFHSSVLFAIPFLALLLVNKGEGYSVIIIELVFLLLFLLAAFSGAKYQDLFYSMSNLFFAERADVYSSYVSDMNAMSYSIKSLVRLAFPFAFALLALPLADRKEFSILVFFIVGQIIFALFGFEGTIQRISLYCTIFALPAFMIIANHLKERWLRYSFCAGTLLLNVYLFMVMMENEQYAGYLNYNLFFLNFN